LESCPDPRRAEELVFVNGSGAPFFEFEPVTPVNVDHCEDACGLSFRILNAHLSQTLNHFLSSQHSIAIPVHGREDLSHMLELLVGGQIVSHEIEDRLLHFHLS